MLQELEQLRKEVRHPSTESVFEDVSSRHETLPDDGMFRSR
jgi:hypothetical protein